MTSGQGLVSIIIPLFNRKDLTQQCLRTLQATAEGPQELVLVDNGSTDGTAELLRQVDLSWRPFQVITNARNLGFAKACNQGAAAARGEHLLFLNNDIEALPGWLGPLQAVLAGHPSVAAVGSKLLYPDGTIQHAGVVVLDHRGVGDPLLASHIFARHPADHPEANVSRTYQALTGACLLVRRSCFEAVGGFDEEFWNGYEDVDLCFRLGERGWRLVYEPASVLVHHEAQSGPERLSRAQENIRLLHRKWRGRVQADFIVSPFGRVKITARGQGHQTLAELP